MTPPDDMAEAHRRDYDRLGENRDLARALRQKADEMSGQRGAASLTDAAEVLEAENAVIVRRWD